MTLMLRRSKTWQAAVCKNGKFPCYIKPTAVSSPLPCLWCAAHIAWTAPGLELEPPTASSVHSLLPTGLLLTLPKHSCLLPPSQQLLIKVQAELPNESEQKLTLEYFLTLKALILWFVLTWRQQEQSCIWGLWDEAQRVPWTPSIDVQRHKVPSNPNFYMILW